MKSIRDIMFNRDIKLIFRNLARILYGALLLMSFTVTIAQSDTHAQESTPDATGSIKADALYYFLLDVSASMEWSPDRDLLMAKTPSESRRGKVRAQMLDFVDNKLYQADATIVVFVSVFGTELRAQKELTAAKAGKVRAFTISKPADVLPLRQFVESVYGSACKDTTTRLYDAICDGLCWYTAQKAKYPPQAFLHMWVLTDGKDEKDGKIRDWDTLTNKEHHPELKTGKIDWFKYIWYGPGQPPIVGDGLTSIKSSGFVRLEVQEKELQLKSFTSTPVQKASIHFTKVIPGYTVQLQVAGVSGCELSPRTVSLDAVEHSLTLTAGPGVAVETAPRIVFCQPTRTVPDAEQMVFLDLPVTFLRIEAASPPPLRFPGLVEQANGVYSVSVLPNKHVEIKAESNTTCKTITWEWAQDGRQQSREGNAAEFAFSVVGDTSVSVRAISKFNGANGQPLQTTKTIRMSAIEAGINFRTVPFPVWLDEQPVKVSVDTVGKVASVDLEIDGTTYTGKSSADHTFRKAGEYVAKARATVGQDQVKNTMTLNVIEPPKLVIVSPAADNYQCRVDESLLFSVGNAESFREVRWFISGKEYQGVKIEYRPSVPGPLEALVRAKAAVGGSREFTATRRVEVIKAPMIAIVTPDNFAYLDKNKGHVFKVGNETEFKDGTLKWQFPDLESPKTGGQVEHRFAKTGSFVINCSGEGRNGLAANATLNVTVVEDPALEISVPRDGATIYVGQPFTLGIKDPEVFSDVKWKIGDEDRAGASPECTFSTEQEDVVIRVSAKAKVGISNQEKTAQVTIQAVKPSVVITAPQEDQRIMVGDVLTVAGATNGPVEKVDFKFLDANGKVVVPEGSADKGFVFRKIGDYKCQAVGTVRVGSSTFEVTDARRFRVVLYPLAINISCSGKTPSGPFRYSDSLVFHLEGPKAALDNIEAVRWDLGDGAKPELGKLEKSHVFNRYGTYKVAAVILLSGGAQDTVSREVTLLAEAPKATPGVFLNNERITRLVMPKKETGHAKWAVELRNDAKPKGDIIAETWTVITPTVAKAEKVNSPGSYTINSVGRYTFTYEAKGVPNQIGAAAMLMETSLCLDVAYERNWALFVCICVAALAAFVVGCRFYAGNGPRAWVCYSKVTDDGPKALCAFDANPDKATTWPCQYVGKKWCRWQKKAEFTLAELCTDAKMVGAASGRKTFKITGGGLTYDPKGVLRPHRMQTARLVGNYLPGSSNGEDMSNQLAVVIDKKDFRRWQQHDELWIVALFLVLAAVICLAWTCL